VNKGGKRGTLRIEFVEECRHAWRRLLKWRLGRGLQGHVAHGEECWKKELLSTMSVVRQWFGDAATSIFIGERIEVMVRGLGGAGQRGRVTGEPRAEANDEIGDVTDWTRAACYVRDDLRTQEKMFLGGTRTLIPEL